MRPVSEQEFFACYQVPAQVIADYKRWNPLQKSAQEASIYGAEDKKYIELLLTLRAMGFSRRKQEEYLRLAVTGAFYPERTRLLREHRAHLLTRVHEIESQISQIDNIIYQWENKQA